MRAVPPIDWLAVAPVAALGVVVVAVVMLRSLVRRAGWVTDAATVVALVGIAAAAAACVLQWREVRDRGAYQAVAGAVAVDGFSVFVSIVVLGAAAATLLLSRRYVAVHDLPYAVEYLVLVCCAVIGMLVMAGANDLLVVFVALEVLSIPLYLLTAFDRRRRGSLEGGMKYFVLGSFASAVFLYGVALTYGATGSTSLPAVAGFLARTTPAEAGTLLAGVMLMLVGLGFKIAAVPFHTWAPDAYQGAPTPVTAFMASATKAAALAALARVLLTAFDAQRADWRPVIWALAVATLVFANLGALAQRDVKRMLAYSSVAHGGFILIGLEAASSRGRAAALFYVAVYALMAVGTFGVLAVLAQRGERFDLTAFAGLGRRRPVLAGVLTLLLLAQAGVPATSGFVAKLGVFEAAAQARSYALLVVGVLAAVVGVVYYLRVILAMYTGSVTDGTEPAEEANDGAAVAGAAGPPLEPRPRVDVATGFVLAAAVTATLWFGLAPGGLLDLAERAKLLF